MSLLACSDVKPLQSSVIRPNGLRCCARIVYLRRREGGNEWMIQGVRRASDRRQGVDFPTGEMRNSAPAFM